MRRPAHAPNYSIEEFRWIQRRNLENFVEYYSDDLRQIQHTGRIPCNWNGRVRRRARREGIILPLNHRTYCGPLNFILSPLTIELLENTHTGGESGE